MAVLLPPDSPWSVAETSRYAAESLWMCGYSFDRYRSRAKAKPALEIELVHAGRAAVVAGIGAGEKIGRAVCLARDLVNEPAAVAHPRYLAARAKEVAAKVGARLRLIEGEELERQGFGAIWAVGRAAEHLPVLAALEWGGAENPALALVGKGVTFDTGGLDLKPSSAMALMKKDMGGAATALGAFQAIAELDLPLHLVCVLGLAENSVGPKSYRPGDIVRSKAGLSIEITNTDAEGRVVLADALALAREYDPRWMIDLATLTGACRVALGKDIMGLFCDDKELSEALQASGAATGEALWPLPLWAPYKKKMESPVADLINATTDGMAGAVTAALFLQEFAGGGAWAHLDFYAWSEGDSPLFPKGGSGAGVRLLVELAQRLSQGAKA
jgi:leucyl aminopeptidase